MGEGASHHARKQEGDITGATSWGVPGVTGTIAHLTIRQGMERSVQTPVVGGGKATTGATLISAGTIALQEELEMEKYLLGLTSFYFPPSYGSVCCLCYSQIVIGRQKNCVQTKLICIIKQIFFSEVFCFVRENQFSMTLSGVTGHNKI